MGQELDKRVGICEFDKKLIINNVQWHVFSLLTLIGSGGNELQNPFWNNWYTELFRIRIIPHLVPIPGFTQDLKLCCVISLESYSRLNSILKQFPSCQLCFSHLYFLPQLSIPTPAPSQIMFSFCHISVNVQKTFKYKLLSFYTHFLSLN